MVDWSFPSTVGGQIKGVADAGIETFNGGGVSALTREICQNSLDAPLCEGEKPVIVEFHSHFVKNTQIPGIEAYRKMLGECRTFWNQSESEKAKAFLKEAVNKVNSENGFVLRISDFNTKGLSEPYGDSSNPSMFSFEGWNSLVRIDGGANSGDDKGGAYGIGKNAPFSNSYYRLVFYRTLNKANETAAQGVSRILSSRDCEGRITSGIGYYGETEGTLPVSSIAELDKLFQRTEVGTDVFVYGFKNADKSWENEVLNEALDSFLVSIHNRQLEVKVQNKYINKDSYAAFIKSAYRENPKRMKETYGSYLALTRKEGVTTFTNSFHGMGTLVLRVLVDPSLDLDRRVLVVRRAGMKLFRLGRISNLFPFTGVLQIQGKDLNGFFRQMESVAHDKWEPKRHKDEKLAEQYYKELRQWVQECVESLYQQPEQEEIEVEGLSGVLSKTPDQPEEGDSEHSKETLSDLLGEVEIINRGNDGYSTKGEFSGKDGQTKEKTDPVPGVLTDDNDDPAARKLKGKRQRKKKDSHSGREDKNGADIVYKNGEEKKEQCQLSNVRIIKLGAGQYKVSFELPRLIDLGEMKLVTVGENGRSEWLRIKSVMPAQGCRAYVEENIVKMDHFTSNQVRMSLTLLDTRNYAMEVRVYENN